MNSPSTRCFACCGAAVLLVAVLSVPGLRHAFDFGPITLAQWCVAIVAVLSVPGLRHAFDFGPITLAQWCVAIVAGIAGVAWFEVYKTISARRHAHSGTRAAATSRQPRDNRVRPS